MSKVTFPAIVHELNEQIINQSYTFAAMARTNYRYNPETLTFERYKQPAWYRIFKIVGFVAIAFLFSILNITLYSYFFPTPKEKAQQREIEQMAVQYELMTKKLSQMETVLDQLAQKDKNLYRVIFEAEPIPESFWEGGYGGVDRASQFRHMKKGELLALTSRRLHDVKSKLVILSKSYQELAQLAANKEELLSHIPAIQPVSNKDLKRLSSGFGYRYHPILKYRKFHYGTDFTAPTGTAIYSTGDGVVEKARRVPGYGNHVVINHGFGYKTIYAHMSEIKVRRGQKIKRGQVLGLVGNTGLSRGPHLHYEVVKNGKKVNPVHYFTNDLTAGQYEEVLRLSRQANQSLD